MTEAASSAPAGLFQRGNAPCHETPAIDATGDVSWRALLAHPLDTVSPPSVANIRVYDLGLLDGLRLTFSAAEVLDDGRILYPHRPKARPARW